MFGAHSIRSDVSAPVSGQNATAEARSRSPRTNDKQPATKKEELVYIAFITVYPNKHSLICLISQNCFLKSYMWFEASE